MLFENWIEPAAAIITLLSAWLLIVKVIVPTFSAIQHFRKTVLNFFKDWTGEEARPGRDAVPGVMHRLNSMDGALKNNGGGSLKDAVDRIEHKVLTIDKRLASTDQEFETIYNEIEEMKTSIDRRKEQSPIDHFDRRFPMDLD
jgi:hypothetical protein